MRFSALLVKLSLGIAFLVLCNSALFAQDAELVRHFDYDAKAPLEMKVLGTEKRGEATVYDITYASPKGGVVPAYLVVPAKGKGSFAGVLWATGIGQTPKCAIANSFLMKLWRWRPRELFRY